MADYTVNIDLPDHKRGDRWIGIGSIGPVLINGVTPTNSLIRFRMQFERKGNGLGSDPRFVIDSEAGGDALGVIDNATTWEAHIDEVQAFLPSSGEWVWDMEFYDSGNTGPLTLYKGVLTVPDDV